MSQSSKKLKQAQLPFKACSQMAVSPSGAIKAPAVKKRPISKEDISGGVKKARNSTSESDCGEVSSSSDEPRPTSPQKRTRAPLDQFVSVQRPAPEVTTSTGVSDVAEENKENVAETGPAGDRVSPAKEAWQPDAKADEAETPVSEGYEPEESAKENNDTVSSDVKTPPKIITAAAGSSEANDPEDVVVLDDDCEDSAAGPPGAEPMSPGAPKSDTPMASSVKKKKTPKQLQRESIRARKEQEKLAEKQKKEEEKERLRKEKLDQKEKERKEKEEKKEKERLEKEKEKLDKQKQKEAEKQQKEAEKAKREEEKKRQKEEERLAKEEEKRKAEEEEEKKRAKAKQMFSSFFVKKPVESEAEQNDNKEVASNVFQQFRVKEDMVLAPAVRPALGAEERASLEATVDGRQAASPELYLRLLKSGAHQPRSRGRTLLPVQRDIEIIEDDEEEGELAGLGTGLVLSSAAAAARRLRFKLLLFRENRRPAYWGTWSKRSRRVTARRPLGRDQVLNYEEDSDDDWEEEDPNGESLSGSEKEVESEDEYDVDNEFFVPHGYLSDEEVKDEEEVMDPEARKAKLKQKGEEFDKEMKKKTTALKPRLIGCVWQDEDCVDPVYQQLVKLLRPFAVRPLSELPVPTAVSGEVKPPATAGTSPATTPASAQPGCKFLKHFPDEALLPLSQLVHGSSRSKVLLVREFSVYWKRRVGALSPRKADPSSPAGTPATGEAPLQPAGQILSKKKICDKLMEIAEYGRCAVEGPLLNRCCWQVKPEVLAALPEQPPLPNQWKWITKAAVKRESMTPVLQAGAPSPLAAPAQAVATASGQKPRASVALITKFTKKVTAEEARRELLSPPQAKRKIVPTQLSSPQLSVTPTASPDARQTPKSGHGISKFFKASPSAGGSAGDSGAGTPRRRVALTPAGAGGAVTPRRLTPTPVAGTATPRAAAPPRQLPLVTLPPTSAAPRPLTISVKRARELVAAQKTAVSASADAPAARAAAPDATHVETITLE